MCDYSLMGLPNRLAVKGEQLVVHRFRTGSLGLASPSDLEPANPPTGQPKTFWARAKALFAPLESRCVSAVCIPPGAQLIVWDIPVHLQQALHVGSIENVTFTQITAPAHRLGQFEASGTYRDSVRFKNGRELRLQDFREGQRMWVMGLSSAEVSEPVPEIISRVYLPSESEKPDLSALRLRP